MYQGIAPLSARDRDLASPELTALAQVWRERHAALVDTGAFHEFLERLQREWAIETGILERLYTWDRGVTEVLIEQGIDASVIAHRGGLRAEEAEHAQALIRDQLDVVEGLFSFVKGERPPSEHFIRSLQARFTAHQAATVAVTPGGRRVRVRMRRGEYKQQPDNPRRADGSVHDHCPPELTREEMQRLLRWYRESEGDVAPEVLAAWLHHRFTQIHPFQDGNGRVARSLASLVFLKAELLPLVIRDAERETYIDALEVADRGDLEPLVTLFCQRQKASILEALGLEQQVERQRLAEDIISSAMASLRRRSAAQTPDVERIQTVAERLSRQAENRLEEISRTLNDQVAAIGEAADGFGARVESAADDSERRHHHQAQILETARQLKYPPTWSLTARGSGSRSSPGAPSCS